MYDFSMYIEMPNIYICLCLSIYLCLSICNHIYSYVMKYVCPCSFALLIEATGYEFYQEQSFKEPVERDISSM